MALFFYYIVRRSFALARSFAELLLFPSKVPFFDAFRGAC